jgi:fumarate reductase subunit D
MILVTGLAVPLGLLSPEALAYDRMLALVGNPIGKGLVFLAVFLPLWHAAHRLRITVHDLGIRNDTIVMMVCYGAALLGTVVAVVSLAAI